MVWDLPCARDTSRWLAVFGNVSSAYAAAHGKIVGVGVRERGSQKSEPGVLVLHDKECARIVYIFA